MIYEQKHFNQGTIASEDRLVKGKHYFLKEFGKSDIYLFEFLGVSEPIKAGKSLKGVRPKYDDLKEAMKDNGVSTIGSLEDFGKKAGSLYLMFESHKDGKVDNSVNLYYGNGSWGYSYNIHIMMYDAVLNTEGKKLKSKEKLGAYRDFLDL